MYPITDVFFPLLQLGFLWEWSSFSNESEETRIIQVGYTIFHFPTGGIADGGRTYRQNAIMRFSPEC
jgi:hypothetical protein